MQGSWIQQELGQDDTASSRLCATVTARELRLLMTVRTRVLPGGAVR
jgi:hypothetical protein